MSWICPICNGLASYLVRCSDCSRQMDARGAIEDYFDNYSPYLDKDITETMDGVEEGRCVHIFYCPSCGQDKRIVINQIKM